MKSAARDKWQVVDAVRANAGIGDTDVPTETFTAAEYREHFDLPEQTAFQQLARLVRAGKLKSGVRLMKDSVGRRRSTKVYWPA